VICTDAVPFAAIVMTALHPVAAEYATRLLHLEPMRAWYADALAEKFRDIPHESEIGAMGTVFQDLRSR